MDDCIEFEGCRNKKGYGVKNRNSKSCLAHRLAWLDTHGEIPDGLFVLHKCDNPACINLEHLFLGTNLDNMRDMISKGRNRQSTGSCNGNAKLIEQDIPEIRARLASGEAQAAIARSYGVGRAAINKISQGACWKCVR
jgi:hypothetical protein